MNDSGFVIFSNDIEYEFKILNEYLGTEFESIVFVYSLKNDVSDLYVSKLLSLKKKIVPVPFEDYNKIEYASVVESLDLSRTVMIIKDLRFMLKRLDERLSMMQIKHSCYKKIIIDEVPFVVDMWKFYFPYSFFDKTLLGYSHSYAFEAAIRNFENDSELLNPYDPVELARKTRKATFINYSRYFLFDLEVKDYEVSLEELAEYEALKDKLFNSEKSIRKIILKLYKYSSSLIPEHNLPLNLNKIYSWKSMAKVIIHKTNLKVDNYLYSEMIKLIKNTNLLTENLRGD